MPADYAEVVTAVGGLAADYGLYVAAGIVFSIAAGWLRRLLAQGK